MSFINSGNCLSRHKRRTYIQVAEIFSREHIQILIKMNRLGLKMSMLSDERAARLDSSFVLMQRYKVV